MLPSHEEDKALKDGVSFVLPEKDKNGRYVVFMRPGNTFLQKIFLSHFLGSYINALPIARSGTTAIETTINLEAMPNHFKTHTNFT